MTFDEVTASFFSRILHTACIAIHVCINKSLNIAYFSSPLGLYEVKIYGKVTVNKTLFVFWNLDPNNNLIFLFYCYMAWQMMLISKKNNTIP